MSLQPHRVQLNFGTLPLIEVAVRASFGSPVQLTYEIINGVHEQLKPRFPNLTEPQQIEIAPGVGPVPLEIGPTRLPGALFVGNTSGLSASLNPQVIVVRWLKQNVPAAADYPRFSALREALWDAVAAFRACASDSFAGIAVLNMSYVNLVITDDVPIRNYFSTDAWVNAMDRASSVRKVEASWSKVVDIDVRFAVEQVTAVLGETTQEGYRLTTAAGMRLAESLDAKSALERVHDELQTFFLDLISPTARSKWGLKEIPLE